MSELRKREREESEEVCDEMLLSEGSPPGLD
jgi:hypothetical protein